MPHQSLDLLECTACARSAPPALLALSVWVSSQALLRLGLLLLFLFLDGFLLALGIRPPGRQQQSRGQHSDL